MGRVLRIIGVYAFRCEMCSAHFSASINSLRHVLWAKCNRCHRMDLSKWSREYYSPALLTRMMLAIGAKAVRCEYCRNNFWSFRLVREEFSKQKRAARSQVVIPVEDQDGAPESKQETADQAK